MRINWAKATETEQQREDMLYSRNKWHMVCNHVGLDPRKSCAADIMDLLDILDRDFIQKRIREYEIRRVQQTRKSADAERTS